MLIVALEPTPYNFDLFNAFAQSHHWVPSVYHTQQRNWDLEAGHDFQDLPYANFALRIVSGQTTCSKFCGLWKLFRTFLQLKPKCTIVCGNHGIIPLMAIFLCIVTLRRLAFWGDRFNPDPPSRGGVFASIARRMIRKVIILKSTIVMVCGRKGIESAIKVGCPPQKVINFPYVVDSKRLRSSHSQHVPGSCLNDLKQNKTVIMFSGRMIPRKGLPTLLEAISLMHESDRSSFWIEGDGPSFNEYQVLAEMLEVKGRCIFLGFCQMDLHAWLISNADIIVVPSLKDPWGIVVDEGMQMGKVVCASDSTFSALDRIVHGKNGFLFPTGDSKALRDLLRDLISAPDLREKIGHAALCTAKAWTPQRNVEAFTRSFCSKS